MRAHGRRRTAATSTAITGALLLAQACAGGAEPVGLPVATDACAAPEFPDVLFSPHITRGEEPSQPYSSTPATSGPHPAEDAVTGVREQPLSDPEVSLALELGQIVVAYDPAALTDEQVGVLTDLAGGALDGRLTVAPYTANPMDGLVVVNGWGVRQSCQDVDTQAVERFVAAFQQLAPGADT